MFARLTTQWNLAVGMSGVAYTGINYQSLETLFNIYKTKNRRRIFEDIRIMESAALKVRNNTKGD